jgi:hypothetical protein
MNGSDLQGAKPQRLSRAAARHTQPSIPNRADAGRQLAGSSKWAGTGNPSQCPQPLGARIDVVMHEPWMSHVGSTADPRIEQRNKDGTPAAPR